METTTVPVVLGTLARNHVGAHRFNTFSGQAFRSCHVQGCAVVREGRFSDEPEATLTDRGWAGLVDGYLTEDRFATQEEAVEEVAKITARLRRMA